MIDRSDNGLCPWIEHNGAEWQPRQDAPAGRVGEPRDVAALAAYLVGDSAGYVTGALLHVDGGYALGGLPPLSWSAAQ